MDFNDSAKFVPNNFKGSNIKMVYLQEKFDFIKYNDTFYLMRFNETYKKDLTTKLFDISEDMNVRLLNNTILKKVSDEEYHFVGQIDEPSIFLQYTKVSKEKGWIKLLEYDGSSLSVPQEHEKFPLYYYIDMAHSVYTRARGTYYCVFYHDNAIWAASQKGLFKLDRSNNEGKNLDAYTIDALLYLFSLTSVVYGEFDRSNHFPNTFITACVRTPVDVFFNDLPKYDVTFISGHLPFPFFYIKAHTRKHFTGVKQVGDANIQYPSKLWPTHLMDYENRTKGIDLYSQLEVYSSKFKTSMVISNEDNHLVEFLIHGSMRITDVALKLIELERTGKLTMGQYTLTRSFTPKEIIRFASDMFKKDKVLHEILQKYYKFASFKANPLAFKSFMYCCYQKLIKRDVNKSVVEILKGKLPEKRFNFYDVKEIDATTPLSEDSQYVIQNDSNKKFTLLKLGNKTCQIKRENFIMTCSIVESTLGLYTLEPKIEPIEFEISLGEKYSSDISNIMKNLKDQFDRSTPEYILTTEDSTPLPPYKYQISKVLLEKILVFLHFDKDRTYSQVEREIVDEFFEGAMLPVRSNMSIRTSNGVETESMETGEGDNVKITHYILKYGQTSLKIPVTFVVKTDIKKTKSFTKVEGLFDVPTPYVFLYMIAGRRLDLLDGTETEHSLSELFQTWIKSKHVIENLDFDKTLFFRENIQKRSEEIYTYTSNYEPTYGEVTTLKNLFKKA